MRRRAAQLKRKRRKCSCCPECGVVQRRWGIDYVPMGVTLVEWLDLVRDGRIAASDVDSASGFVVLKGCVNGHSVVLTGRGGIRQTLPRGASRRGGEQSRAGSSPAVLFAMVLEEKPLEVE